MALLNLVNSTKKAIVDSDILAICNSQNLRWSIDTDGYPRRRVGKKTIRLQNFIFEIDGTLDPSRVRDHINGDRLDNRRANLRQCTVIQNNWSRSIYRSNTSGYRGVVFHRNKFYASIRHLKKRIHIGVFDTAEEAAKAFDEKARELRGEFARLNFPERAA